MNSPEPILSVRHLAVHFPVPPDLPWHRPGSIRAVDGVHFNLLPGETLGIVGESGCGKSTLARTLVGLQPATSGVIFHEGREVTHLDEAGWRGLRRDIQMIFQDPFASLNPRMTLFSIVEEPLRNLCPELDAAGRRQRVVRIIERVGLSEHQLNRYPHEFSGGQCQRIGIARALVVEPRILICDEPVSALDVSIQAQIINLLMDLQNELGLSMIFIAHDLAVVRHISHRVLVMYLGHVMEQATRNELFEQASHPYTKSLLSAVPVPDPAIEKTRERILLHGDLPSPADPPDGCVFRTRCPWATDLCGREKPPLRHIGGSDHAACHFAQRAS